MSHFLTVSYRGKKDHVEKVFLIVSLVSYTGVSYSESGLYSI